MRKPIEKSFSFDDFTFLKGLLSEISPAFLLSLCPSGTPLGRVFGSREHIQEQNLQRVYCVYSTTIRNNFWTQDNKLCLYSALFHKKLKSNYAKRN